MRKLPELVGAGREAAMEGLLERRQRAMNHTAAAVVPPIAMVAKLLSAAPTVPSACFKPRRSAVSAYTAQPASRATHAAPSGSA